MNQKLMLFAGLVFACLSLSGCLRTLDIEVYNNCCVEVRGTLDVRLIDSSGRTLLNESISFSTPYQGEKLYSLKLNQATLFLQVSLENGTKVERSWTFDDDSPSFILIYFFESRVDFGFGYRD